MGYPEINHITLAGSNNRVRIKNNFPEALGLIHCPRWNRTLIYISWDLLLMKKAVNVSLLKAWKRTEATNYIDSILQEFQLFILGCRLTGKDRSLIRIRSRIIPGWPNKESLRYTGRLLETCAGIFILGHTYNGDYICLWNRRYGFDSHCPNKYYIGPCCVIG